MNRKIFLLTCLGTLAVAVGAVCYKVEQPSTFMMTSGTNYNLYLSRSITSDEINAGEADFNTASGYAINFKFDSASVGSGLIDLANGGDFYNNDVIHGISAINVTLLSGTATLTYGNAKDAMNLGSENLSGTSPIAINLDVASDYFKIVATSALSISEISITYSCSNDYQYAVDREVASGDLLYTSTFESQTLNSNHIANIHCFNVVNATSGYSFSLTIPENASAGWPMWYFALADSITASECTLEFYVKGINQTQLNMNLLDSSNNALLKSGNKLIDFTDNWTKISVEINSSTLASGKTPADVAKIKFSQNFGTVANERHIYIDEAHIIAPEEVTRSNIEMCSYVRASFSQTAAASYSYDDVYGSSTASRKLSFADTTGLTNTAASTYRVFAEFDIAANLGNDNGIDVKSCTLSFDIYFSDEIANSEDANHSRVTIDFKDSSGTSSSSWFQMNSITPYGDGWYRYSRNLNGIGAISALSGNVGTIKLGFNGVYTGNQATAYIIVDNIALTAN